MSTKQAFFNNYNRYPSPSGVSALLGDVFHGFRDVFSVRPQKINSPNKRRPRTPEELDLARLRRALAMPAIDLVYHGHKVSMHGSQHILNRRVSPYLQVADFYIYPCPDNSYSESCEAYYQLYCQDILIEYRLNQKQLIARLNELYRLNKERYN